MELAVLTVSVVTLLCSIGVIVFVAQSHQSARTAQSAAADMLMAAMRQSADAQDKRLRELSERLAQFSLQNEQKLDQIREMMAGRLALMQQDNQLKLDAIRLTVEDKLQKTLDERIGNSFKLVSERLEQVYKGLGEMQTLATGVGDLKKVLSGVKTRGILGEYQLGAILEQVLTPEQYAVNVGVIPGRGTHVEFAVKLPGDGSGTVWLPIDSKFPSDRYGALCDAYASGDGALVDACARELVAALKASAREIRDKYIEPPYTTDFGILFLPFEGLYAEVVRRGLIEQLQRDYKINIAGPTTMAALLNALQMGFRTLSIQKRTGEVWAVLGEVKSEFMKFSELLSAAQKKLEAAGKDLDALSGTRTKQILRKLRDVELPSGPEDGE